MKKFSPIRTIHEDLFEEFKMIFPKLNKEIQSWDKDGPNRIYIRLKDGTSLTFDICQTVTFLTKGTDIDTGDGRDMTKEEFISHISSCIKDAMRRRKITQKELSKCIGTTERNLTVYCAGKRTPSLYLLYKITRALRLSFDELLGL